MASVKRRDLRGHKVRDFPGGFRWLLRWGGCGKLERYTNQDVPLGLLGSMVIGSMGCFTYI